jgi:FOG: WD40 repeat
MLLDSRYVTSIGWSHDSQQLASGSYSGEVCVWDPVTRERISTLEGHERPVFHLRWSQDGRLASGSDDQTIKIWNPETRQCTADLGESDGEVLSISWSLDGRWLAAMTHRRRDEDFKIWDLAITVRDSATGQYISSIDVQLPVVQSFDEMSAGEDLPTFLEFDKNTPNRLHTLAGTFDLINDMLISTSPLNLPPAVEQQIGYGLSYDTAWITYRGKGSCGFPRSIARPFHHYSLHTRQGREFVWEYSVGQVV